MAIVKYKISALTTGPVHYTLLLAASERACIGHTLVVRKVKSAIRGAYYGRGVAALGFSKSLIVSPETMEFYNLKA